MFLVLKQYRFKKLLIKSAKNTIFCKKEPDLLIYESHRVFVHTLFEIFHLMTIISLMKKCWEKMARQSMLMVPKKLTRDLWLPAPSDNFTKWSSVRANVSNFIPDRKSGLHPQNRRTRKHGSSKRVER